MSFTTSQNTTSLKTLKNNQNVIDYSYTPWVRNPGWLTLPDVTAQSKIVGLHQIPVGTTYIAFTCSCSTTYIVDWGDGTSNTYSSGAAANHTYDYSTYDVSNTTLVTHNNQTYKQAVITATPTSGTITSIDFTTMPTPLSGYLSNGTSTGWLDISIGIGLSSIVIGKVTMNPAINTYQYLLEQFSILTNTITDFSCLFNTSRNLQSVPSLYTNNGTNFSNMFSNCVLLNTIPQINTSNGTNFSSMFNGCSQLVNIPLFDTSKATTMATMFASCKTLKNIPLLNTPQCTDFSSMFNSCTSLVTVPLMNTYKGTNFSQLFYGCTSLKEVPLFNLKSAITVQYMFAFCYRLNTIPPLDVSSCSSLYGMFQGCTALRDVPLLNTKNVTSFQAMFQDCTSLQTVPLFDTSKATSMLQMFINCTQLKTVPLFNTSQCSNFQAFFYGCTSLNNVPAFNTSQGTNFSQMFYACSKIEVVPLFDTSKATTMAAMFYGCGNLKYVPAFNTSQCTNFSQMFYICYKLTSVPLFDTSKATTMASMFQSATSLLTVPAFNTSSCTNFSSMFASCSSLQGVPLFDTSKGTSNGTMFQYCRSLTVIPDFDCRADIGTGFDGSYAWRLAYVGAYGMKYASTFAYTMLSKSELEKIMNNLGSSPATSQILTITGSLGASQNGINIRTCTWSFAGVTVLNCTNTSGVTVGQIATGTGLGSQGNATVTFTDVGDLVTRNAHGLVDGTKVSFTTIVSTTGIVINTIYYIVNSTTNTFQVSSTLGGAALPLTTDGTGTIKYMSYITAVSPNVSITISTPTIAAGTSISISCRSLDTGNALLKGWTISG